tara:strand:- start:210 stop:404 length:195 start_codon:yes stop_codon:yes gene_type:complete
MKRIIPYIAFAFLTVSTATSGLPVMASGCESHINKAAQIKCAEDDIECQTKKSEKYGVNKTVRS